MRLSMISTFLFSSRRRHTRWPRDWSSDVCSSDLSGAVANPRISATPPPASISIPTQAISPGTGKWSTRSEERRVGKECRSRRWTDHYKKCCEPPYQLSDSSLCLSVGYLPLFFSQL